MIYRDRDISGMNTFGMRVKAACVLDWSSLDELEGHLAEDLPRPLLCIGGGSNLLFEGDFPGTLVHSTAKGISIVGEGSGNEIVAEVAAGEKWDDFCLWACERGLWGVENLSGIPGDAGAAAVQNIGAYGSEVKDAMISALCLDLQTMDTVMMDNASARYAYRDSIFKNEGKGRYIVLSVRFRLGRDKGPSLSYKALSQALEGRVVESLTPMDVREAVLKVRNSKLPDPAVIGSAGSFFRNSYVDAEGLERLRGIAMAEGLGEVPCFVEGERIKVPSAWLLDKCGWKGRRIGGAGVHERQPLVLINASGTATPAEILELERRMVESVKSRFGIVLVPEVEHVGMSK